MKRHVNTENCYCESSLDDRSTSVNCCFGAWAMALVRDHLLPKQKRVISTRVTDRVMTTWAMTSSPCWYVVWPSCPWWNATLLSILQAICTAACCWARAFTMTAAQCGQTRLLQVSLSLYATLAHFHSIIQ